MHQKTKRQPLFLHSEERNNWRTILIRNFAEVRIFTWHRIYGVIFYFRQ